MFSVLPENQGVSNLLLVVKMEHCIEMYFTGKDLELDEQASLV